MFAPPRNAVAFLTSLSVFERKGSFALCGERPKGFALWKPTTFEKDYKRPKPEDSLLVEGDLYGKIDI